MAGARPLYEESLRLRRLVGDRPGIAVSLNSLALLRGLAGELETARELSDESLALRRDLGDRAGHRRLAPDSGVPGAVGR